MAEHNEHELLNDLPENDPSLLWDGLRSLSDRLATQIPRLPSTSPVMISGDWGSGKTTLLRAIQNELHAKEVPTVWFEAWRYEGEGLLLPALMRSIWVQCGKDKEPDTKLRDRLWNAAVAVATGIGPEVAALLGGPAALGFKSLLALKKGEDDQKKNAAPDGPPEDATQTLWESFRELLDELWGDGEPLIIFIDDLDRCSPSGAVDLLDALRMLIGQTSGNAYDPDDPGPNCRFVVALDRTVLAEAVAKKFSEISRYDGNRYLEKIFPITFDLPRPEGTSVHQFVHLFLRKAAKLGEKTADGADGKEENVSHLDALSVALSEPMFANPRLMKRCINRFYLVLRFEDAQCRKNGDSFLEFEHDDPDPEEYGKQQLTLASWIAASERWPHLRRLLSRRDDEYWKKIRRHLIDADNGLPDADARRLLDDQGIKTWLLRELLGGKGTRLLEFRQANRRLRKWGL